jgi:hypothetical protein
MLRSVRVIPREHPGYNGNVKQKYSKQIMRDV